MERSTQLTPNVTLKAERALRAAEAKRVAGDLDAALGLAKTAQRGPLDSVQLARLDVLRAQILFAAHRGNEAPALLLQAAYRLEPFDPSAARETYLEALAAAVFAGRFSTGASADDVARAARTSPRPEGPPRPSDLLLDGLALLVTEGPVTGTPAMQRALEAFRSHEVSSEDQLRWSWLAARVAGGIWEHESWDLLSARQLEAARDMGALNVLPLSLSTRVGVKLFAGEIEASASLVEQLRSVADVIDTRTEPLAALKVAAFRGDEAEAMSLFREAHHDLIERGEGVGLSIAQCATAVLYNGLAQYDRALVSASLALKHPNELWFLPWTTVELIEAASRTGNIDQATVALTHLAEGTTASGTDWACSVEARCRALLTDGHSAETLYREAIDRVTNTPMRWDLARARLVYGEWLRRERRTKEAREQLRTAEELFSDFGARAFAGRARVERRATGERTRKRSTTARFDLTPQETQISRLVSKGSTNREIASKLFISTSTVEYHLHKVFQKLGVRTRAQLAQHFFESAEQFASPD
jgi:DNA-binding CsgD family transcriptional regulator